MRGLDIRCDFALLKAANPHLRSFSIQGHLPNELSTEESKFVDLCCQAYGEGQQEGYNAHIRPEFNIPPCMFSDEPELLNAWKAGWQSGQECRSEYDYLIV